MPTKTKPWVNYATSVRYPMTADSIGALRDWTRGGALSPETPFPAAVGLDPLDIGVVRAARRGRGELSKDVQSELPRQVMNQCNRRNLFVYLMFMMR